MSSRKKIKYSFYRGFVNSTAESLFFLSQLLHIRLVASPYRSSKATSYGQSMCETCIKSLLSKPLGR
jgi:hypothetical protein